MSRKQKPVPVTIVPEVAESYRPKDSIHMSIRQIENGFLVNTHGYRNGEHFDKDVYTKHAPKINIPGARWRAEPVAAPKPPAQPVRKARPAPAVTKPRGEKKVSSFMSMDMAPAKGKVKNPSILNVPSDTPLPRLKAQRNVRLRNAKL